MAYHKKLTEKNQYLFSCIMYLEHVTFLVKGVLTLLNDLKLKFLQEVLQGILVEELG